MNGLNTIEEILLEPVYIAQSEGIDEAWPDSVHHQSWHDSWRNSH